MAWLGRPSNPDCRPTLVTGPFGGMLGGMTGGMMGPRLARVDPARRSGLTARRPPKFSPIPGRSCYDAAKESNLPSRGLPGPAGFEDRMGHQAPAAPLLILCAW